ncbi:MAG: DUF2085 domain-containing protein [Anaerolineae bacterium]|nr:DUF2085 domain-containing protein [Anaerolineae bacterium]
MFALLVPEEPVRLPFKARDFGMYVGFLAVWAYLGILGRGRAKGIPPAPILLTLVLFVGAMGFDGLNAFAYDLHKAVTLFDALKPFAAGVFFAPIKLGMLSMMRYTVLGTMILP